MNYTYINNTENKYINKEDSIEISDNFNTDDKNEIVTKNIKNNNNNKKPEEKEENDLDYNIEKEHDELLIDSKLIEYKKKYSLNKNVWWPISLSYGGKKYYPSTHSSYLIKNTTTILKYFCVNNKLNTHY